MITLLARFAQEIVTCVCCCSKVAASQRLPTPSKLEDFRHNNVLLSSKGKTNGFPPGKKRLRKKTGKSTFSRKPGNSYLLATYPPCRVSMLFGLVRSVEGTKRFSGWTVNGLGCSLLPQIYGSTVQNFYFGNLKPIRSTHLPGNVHPKNRTRKTGSQRLRRIDRLRKLYEPRARLPVRPGGLYKRRLDGTLSVSY